MLTKAQKAKIVEELKEKFLTKKAVFFVSFTGVDVKTSQDMRKQVKGGEGEYKVVKKTLLERALKTVNFSVPLGVLQGQVGLAFDYGSEVGVVKTLFGFTKKTSFLLLGGIIGQRFLSADQVKELALLPALEVMRGRLVFAIKSPLSGFIHTLKGVQLQVINILKAIATKK